MSAKAIVFIVMTFLDSGNPYKAVQADPPAYGIDLKVREIRADRLPGSYQITLTVAF